METTLDENKMSVDDPYKKRSERETTYGHKEGRVERGHYVCEHSLPSVRD
jgi:hypothetical protein